MKESQAGVSSRLRVLGFGLTFPSLSTPAVCPEATRTPSGWTARLSGGRRHAREGGQSLKTPQDTLCVLPEQQGDSSLLLVHTDPDPTPAKPTSPTPRAAHSQASGASPSNAVRVAPVMSLAATSRTPWASLRPVQHHHTGDKVDHLPRAQHKQIRAGVTTPVPVTGVGITVKERVRSRAE